MRGSVLAPVVAAMIVVAALGSAVPAGAVVPAVDVSVCGQTSFTRTWCWTIDKECEPDELFLSPTEQGTVMYTVTCDATPHDSGFAVAGQVCITNNTGAPVTINAVSVVVAPDIPATVDCDVTLPVVLPAGETLCCDFCALLPCAMTRNITATVDTSAGVVTGMGVADFACAQVNEIDEMIDVVDSWQGYLGSCTAGDASDPFQYCRVIGPCPVCGDWPVVNTVHFTTNDTCTTGCDDCTVWLHVACEEEVGCTFTQGYWKTHSEFGPAPYDDTWAELASGASTVFFLSGQTYYQVLWTPPRGNAYYILAHQYIAAQLNMLGGASAPTEVEQAFDQTTALFQTYTPAQIAALSGGSDLRHLFIALGGTLGDYNEGRIGPGSCDDGCADAAAGPSARARVASRAAARSDRPMR
jgi:hypothetical protein